MPPSTREPDRRQYRRVPAAIQVRPVSLLSRAIHRRALDVSLGGLRAYSDEPYRVGTRLELELLLRETAHALVLAEVVWVQPLAPGAPALFDVGLRYVVASPEDLARIERAMDQPLGGSAPAPALP